ncbi:PAR10-like protein [Mya arenaria]|uniref:PAR10-like protein n=1 Tax=Mya arenaria TaxID=6604 RepID=A0ABY7FJF3_MYAAR|nr:PAR10-like protein [Mya arenaria]
MGYGLYSHTDQEPYPSLRKLPEIDNKAVIVKNLPASYTGDSEHLQLFFESKKRVGRELDVQDVQIVNNAEAVVTFKTAEDAREVVSRIHKLSDCDLTVVPFITSKVEVLFEKVRDACTKHAIDGHHLKPKSIPVTTSITVFELPEDVTNDHVWYYFENKKRSCGGDVLNIDEHFEDGYCIVSFKQASVVQRVCSKRGGHSLCEVAVQVAPYNHFLGLPFGCDVSSHRDAAVITLGKHFYDTQAVQYTEPSAACGSEDNAIDQYCYNSVEVTGFTDDVTNDTFRYYFENKRKSGGGDILDVQVNREEGVAHIMFKEESDAMEVVSRTHKLNDCDLTVVPFITSKLEVLFEDLPYNITEDSLENYIGAKVRGSEVCKVTFNQNRDKAVVLFAENIDIEPIT